METLTLTSPNTEGAAVRHAQQVLAKNKYGKFHTEEIDGIFGPETARSCKRATYWLGYAESQLDPTFGSLIEALLEGKKELTATQAARRKARIKADKANPLREKAFAEAMKHVGLFEKFTDSSGNFTAIEGNTAAGNDANGGEVQRRKRNTSQILGFVHVGG